MSGSGLNSAALAERMGVDRKALRRSLSGKAAMSLQDFIAAMHALDVDPSDLSWPTSEEALGSKKSLAEASEALTVDPFGLQGEQAFRLGFALGVDFLFVAKTSLLKESGIPDTVLSQWPDEIVLKLDAAYHRHNEPRFSPKGVGLKLSFDSLCDCFLPWSAIQKVVFHLESPEPEQEEEPDPPSRGPGLRLVKG